MKNRPEEKQWQLFNKLADLPGANALIKEWINENPEADALARTLWHEARKLIINPNLEWKEQNTAIDAMSNLTDLSREISAELREELIEDMLKVYRMGDYGFSEMLLEACNEMSFTDDEMLNLAEALVDIGSELEAASIFLELEDEKRYLEIKERHLKDSYDYIQLAMHHKERGRDSLAASYIDQAISKFKDIKNYGLANSLFSYHKEYSGPDEVEAVLELCHDSFGKQRLKEDLKRYFKDRGDYAKTKEYMLELFKVAKGSSATSLYNEMSTFFTKEDWEPLESEFFKVIKSEDYGAYIRMCKARGLKSEVLAALEQAYRLDSTYYSYAKDLIYDYPEKMLDLFIKRAEEYMAQKGRRSAYQEAVSTLEIVKKIQVEILKDKSGWDRRIAAIRAGFKTSRSFLDLSKHLLD
jgi:hypothetical protein